MSHRLRFGIQRPCRQQLKTFAHAAMFRAPEGFMLEACSKPGRLR